MKIKKQMRFGFLNAHLVVLASTVFLYPSLSRAQSALKNIENNATPLPRNERPAQAAGEKVNDQRIYIDKLESIETNNDFLKENILQYWVPFVGKPVTYQNIVDFKEWAWTQFSQAGYFAFLRTDKKKSGQGDKLIIEITLPTIQAVEFHSEEVGLAEAYADQILSALGKAAQPGQTVDTLGLEQKLDNIGFALPASLTLSVRQTEADRVILVVNLESKVAAEPGSLRSGAVQLNNYGLKQYGRTQALGVLTFNGWTPDATATLTAQGAEGLAYARADYEAPSELVNGHVRLFAESVFSKNIYGGSAATQGLTGNFGVGSTNILGSDRDLVYKSYLDLSHRDTNSQLQSSGAEVSSLVDNQARFKVSGDNSKLATDLAQNWDVNFVTGHDDVHGRYYFGVLDAALQKNLNNEGLSLSAKFKTQFLPTRNLDTYNRFTLGGVNGVRAYTTLDGMGDSGALASVELKQPYSPEGAVGVFYDGGVVNPNHHPVSGQYNSSYSLQAVGVSLAGTVLTNVNYNTSVAKAVGTYAAYVPGIYETMPHAWRVNFALSYSF